MEDAKKAYVEYLRLSHAYVCEQEETLKSMLRNLSQTLMDAKKLAGLREDEHAESPAPKPTPLHTAAEGFAKAFVRKLPSSVLDALPSDVRKFGNEADPEFPLRSQQIVLELQQLVVEVKKRLAGAIADRKRIEKELKKEGSPVAQTA